MFLTLNPLSTISVSSIKIASMYFNLYLGLQRTQEKGCLTLSEVCSIIRQKEDGWNRPTKVVYQIKSSFRINCQRVEREIQEKY